MKTSLASGGRGSTVVSCGRWSTVVSCGLVYLLAFECSIVMATRLCFHDGFDETDDENGEEDKDSEEENDGEDDEDAETSAAKAHSDGYEEEPYEKPKKKKVLVPVYVPEKEKKKMKIVNVDKGFYIPGGIQLTGKFKSLKHCMKACAITPSCFSGDYNPWLHKCYQHTNLTACNQQFSHPQYVHFSKVPCFVTDAPQGHVTLGASAYNGIESKGIDSLSQCLKKCANAGSGIPATVRTVPINTGFFLQACFAIDYDFATHKCFFFGNNFYIDAGGKVIPIHCPNKGKVYPSSRTTRPNPNVIHITLCPLVVP